MDFVDIPGNPAEIAQGLSSAEEQALKDYGAAEVAKELAAPRLEEEQQEADMALASLEGKRADYGKTLDWIWHKLGSVTVTARDAPSQTAWMLLQHFRSARGEFFKIYNAYTQKAQKDAAEVKEWHDDQRKQMSFIKTLRKEFPKLGMQGLKDLLEEDRKAVEEYMRPLGYIRIPTFIAEDEDKAEEAAEEAAGEDGGQDGPEKDS